MKKRIISLFLAVLMIVSIIPMGTLSASAASSFNYDADAAISFAKKHCATDANNHSATGGTSACDNGWLCAEFVAECLVAGGFPKKLSAVAGMSGFAGQITNYGEKITCTKTGEGYVKMTSFSKTLSKGDPIVILYSKASGSGNGHVVIYSGETADGIPKVYAHNNRKQNEKLYVSSKTVEIFAVHISSSFDIANYNATFVARSTLNAKSEPYSSSTTKRSISNGSTVKVVGYTYNSYGNLWYKTDKGDYLHAIYLEYMSGDDLPPSNYFTGEMELVASSKVVRQNISGTSEVKRTIYKGNTIDVIGYQYNKYGNLWYVLSDGTYVYYNYLSVKNSSIRTPSNYLNGENLKLVASSKSVRSDPYSASDIIRTVKSGEIVTVDGYLYNKYGNLWYLTDKDDYVYESYLQKTDNSYKAPSNYEIKYLITDEDKLAKIDPYSSADTIEDIPKGSKIKTIGYVYNFYGNKWYETDDYFIWDSNLSCDHQYKLTSQTSPTCTTDGVKCFTCSQCNESYSEKSAPKGHTVVTVAGKSATCTSEGLTDGSKCSVCGAIIKAQEKISQIAHNYISKVIAPTENSQGYTLHTCSVCGNNYKDNYTAQIVTNPPISEPIDVNAPQIVVENASVLAGNQVRVNVNIKNNPGFSYLELTPKYSSALELVRVENGVLVSDLTKGKQYIWVADSDVSDDDLLMTFVFNVPETTEPGDYDVSFIFRSAVNYDEQDVEFTVVGGTVSVLDFKYGDANGDNIIDGKDVVRIKKYLANFDYDTNTSTTEISLGADVNGDGIVDGKDVVRLKKYLANYDYETDSSTVILGPQN